MNIFYIILGLLIILMLIIFRKEAHVKKFWKYTLILIPLFILIFLKMWVPRRPLPNKPDPLVEKIQDLKDDLSEVHQIAAIEVAIAKTKNEETLKKLEEVKKIEDKKERRKQLASLIG